MRSIHQPILPQGEVCSPWEGLLRFVPLAVMYSLRHLTLGTWVRFRRRVVRWRGRKHYLS